MSSHQGLARRFNTVTSIALLLCRRLGIHIWPDIFFIFYWFCCGYLYIYEGHARHFVSIVSIEL